VLYIQEDFKPNEDSKETSEEKPESLTALLDEFIRTENVPPISFEARMAADQGHVQAQFNMKMILDGNERQSLHPVPPSTTIDFVPTPSSAPFAQNPRPGFRTTKSTVTSLQLEQPVDVPSFTLDETSKEQPKTEPQDQTSVSVRAKLNKEQTDPLQTCGHCQSKAIAKCEKCAVNICETLLVSHQMVKALSTHHIHPLSPAPGRSEIQLLKPVGVCIDKQGNILIAESLRNHIQIFSLEKPFRFVEKKTIEGLVSPRGVTTKDERIIVTEWANHRISIFNEQGKVDTIIGKGGRSVVELEFPEGVWVDQTGKIIVSEFRKNRVQIFTPTGEVVKKIENNFCNPTGICTTNEGNLIVCDTYNHHLQMFSSSYQHICNFGQDAEVWTPWGVCVDQDNNIVVADAGKQRLTLFTSDGRFTQQHIRLPYDPYYVTVTSNGNYVVSYSKENLVGFITKH
jgi:tripartite motif-containing protein 2/3